MATENHTQQTTESLTEAVCLALGDHPEDVMGFSNTASDVFEWLERIFKGIEAEAEKGRDASYIEVRQMAAMGRYLAADFSNYMDCAREKMTDQLKAAGYTVTPIRGA